MTRGVVLGVCLLLASCSYLDEPGPLPISGTPLAFRRSDPPDGSTNVALNQSFTLIFSSAPDPSVLQHDAVRLFSGVVETVGSLKVDLLRQALRFSPSVALRQDLAYRLRITNGVVGLDGSVLPEPVVVTFATGDQPLPVEQPTPTPTISELQPIWSAHCAGSDCHAPPTVAAHLDLSTPQSASTSLVRIRSRQSQLFRVFPGDHARSYLMRKLLAEPNIIGQPMPPQGPALPAADLQRVVAWIDGDAP